MTNEMTAEEAVEILKYERDNDIFVATEYREKLHEALTKAIKALEAQPSEDCISREAVLDLMADYDLNMGQVVRGIHALPSVKPQPKKGKWTRDSKMWFTRFSCSNCGKFCDFDYFCCPYCGQKKKGVEDDE